MRKRRKYGASNTTPIGCFVLVVLFNISIGTWAVNQILSWFGKDIPFVADLVIGLVTAQISVPVAVIGWILKICGVF